MFEKILVPLDGSENAFRALDAAVDIAKHYDSQITAVVIANDQSYSQYGAIFGGDIMAHMKEQAEKTLQKALERAKQDGMDIETQFEVGIPKQAIAESLPDLLDTTLTVIGKSGVNGLNRAIMGSTTAYVVRRSLTPVLVVGD
ncbi:universal stress protein [Secundilactobacillus folii]|uniref:Universal stress protein n=1 Tax=Secundilactobacillus folii TaxID=2678357 RepID=A0A7X2XUQ2_9LACO|nr:universal stress protein [Secundilactobacillus folii]MTV82028.1 universal stress protein [Secundilactobacillus folii]